MPDQCDSSRKSFATAARSEGSKPKIRRKSSAGSLHEQCRQRHRLYRNNSVPLLLSLAVVLMMVVTLTSMATFSKASSIRLLQRFQQQQSMENRHPLAHHHIEIKRSLRTTPSNMNVAQSFGPLSSQERPPKRNPINYLSIGSAITWGFDHEFFYDTMEDVTYIPYPILLDAHVRPVTLSTGYENLAAACTQTLMESAENARNRVNVNENTAKEDVNVITIEYQEWTSSHEILVKRLRRRFPTAALILVHLMDPASHMILQTKISDMAMAKASVQDKGNNKNDATNSYIRRSLKEWQRDEYPALDKSNTILFADKDKAQEDSLVYNMLMADGVWSFALFVLSIDERISIMMQEDELLLHYQFPLPDNTLSMQTLDDFLSLFNPEDASVLSSTGHALVAQGLEELVATLPWNFSDSAMKDGDWGSGDDCHIWYTSGNYNLESSGRRVNLPLDHTSYNFLQLLGTGLHKHALEFDRLTTSMSATLPISINNTNNMNITANNQIVVHNPFHEDRMLSLTYLTDADRMSYPRTRILVNNIPTVLITPFHNDDNSHYHIARTLGVAMIPPGSSTVQLEPLQSTLYAFRLLGASILADEVQDVSSIEFALEPDLFANFDINDEI